MSNSDHLKLLDSEIGNLRRELLECSHRISELETKLNGLSLQLDETQQKTSRNYLRLKIPFPYIRVRWDLVCFLVIGAVVIILFALAASSLTKPLIMDEMEFPSVAKAITETGKPIYYRGETYPVNVGLWHPPLYILALALWQLIFSSSIVANRTYGLVNAGLALALLGLFVCIRWKSLDFNPKLKTSGLPLILLIGLGSAATAPLLIQGSILPDIDTQVLPLTITASFLLLFILRGKVSERLYWVAFIGVVVLNLFAKLTTPLLLIPVFMLFEFGRQLNLRSQARLIMKLNPDETGNSVSKDKGPLLFIKTYLLTEWRVVLVFTILPLVAGIVSLLLMLLLWLIIALIWGVNFSVPFTYLTQSSNNPAGYANSFTEIIAAILRDIPPHFNYFLQWAGIGPILLVLFLIVREFFKPGRGLLQPYERTAVYLFLILLTTQYLVLRPAPFDFPKYWPPLIPLFSLLVVDLLVTLYRTKQFKVWIAILSLELLVYVLYILIDKNFTFRESIYEVYYSPEKPPIYWRWELFPIISLLIINVVIWFLTKRKLNLTVLVMLVLISVTLGWQATTALKQTQRTYSTTYYYGEDSLNKVVNYLQETLPANVVVIAPKDVGVRIQDKWKYIELDENPHPYLSLPKVEYLVFRRNDYYGNTLRENITLFNEINSKFQLQTSVENFMIYKRKPVIGS